MTVAEASAAFGDKVRREIFKPVVRHISGNDPEDRLQDVVSQTWEMYRVNAIERGRILDSTWSQRSSPSRKKPRHSDEVAGPRW